MIESMDTIDPKSEAVQAETGEEVVASNEGSNMNPLLVCIRVSFEPLATGKHAKQQRPTVQHATISSVSVLETLTYVKQVLLAYVETCFFSNYSFVLSNTPEVALNDFTEISNLVPAPEEQMELTEDGRPIIQLRIVPDLYDVKKIRQHIARVSEIIANPPSATVLTSLDEIDESIKAKLQSKPATKATTLAQLPPGETVFTSIGLASLYAETVFRFNVPVAGDAYVANGFVSAHGKPASCVSSVSVSNWNPAPAHRRMQGDLLYIEVVCPQEGVFNITGTCHGFFVNKSNRHHFDPLPVSGLPATNNLFQLIHSLSGSLRLSWNEYTQALYEKQAVSLIAHDVAVSDADATKKESTAEASPENADDLSAADATTAASVAKSLYSTIADVFEQSGAEFDYGTVFPQWTNYQPGKYQVEDKDLSSSGSGLVGRVYHTNNPQRTQTYLCDTFGVDTNSSPREWNEEMQSVRALTATSSFEAVAKARYLNRINVEFYEACKAGATAVVEGHIAALNPMDPITSQVFVYNNIFFSRALDSKDTFRICKGDVAARKAAGQDVKCQQLLSSQDIPGLSTVMTCVVDYKGDRIIAQTIIPGVLMSGVGAARLMYGAIEFGKRLSVKSEALDIMKSIGEKFYLPTRNISAIPIPSANSTAAVVTADAATESDEASAIAVQTSIRTDTDDESAPSDSLSVPHVGPVEAKLLKGGDGRIYALEFTRLTPLDANYVPVEAGGTGALDADTLAKGDETLRAVYVLRPELIRRYLEWKLEEQQRAVVREAAAKQKEIDDAATAGQALTEEEQKKRSEDFAADITSRLSSLTLSNVTADFALSANSFVNISAVADNGSSSSDDSLTATSTAPAWLRSDVDPAIADKDEVQARNLAVYLFNEVIPGFVNEVRIGEITPLDGASLVDILHQRGINLRYLGQVAAQAQAQELDDANMASENKQRVHMMPTYFQDLVVIEMLARAMKHVANNLLSNAAVKNAPAATLSSLLSHVLGVVSSPVEGEDAGAKATPALAVAIATESSGGKKKKKKTSAATATGSDVIATANVNAVAFVVPNAAADRSQTLKDVENTLLARFLSVPLVINRVNGSAADTNSFLHPRISRVALLRRFCQLTGLKVACRNYNFGIASPLTVDDILGMAPVALSSSGAGSVSCAREDFVAPVIRQLVNTSQRLTSEGALMHAFEVVRQADGLVQDITGPNSREAIYTMDQMVSILINAGDLHQALATACQMLATTAQFTGVDSADSLQQHARIASILLGIRKLYSVSTSSTTVAVSTENNSGANPTSNNSPATVQLAEAAVAHLLATKYITELIGGSRHITLVDIYRKLGLVYFESGDLSLALTCLLEAKARVCDLTIQAVISQSLAEVLAAMGHLAHAVDTQRQAHKLLSDIYGETDDKVVDAKKLVEKYFRASTELNVKYLRKLQAEQEVALAQAAQSARDKQVTGGAPVASAAAAGTTNNGARAIQNGAKEGKKSKSVVGLTEAEIEADAIQNAKKRQASNNQKKKGGKK